jgi:hypothetical protein
MECRGDGTHDGLWQLYDYINGAALAAAEHTLITAAAFSTVTHDYTIPAGCYTLQLYLYAPLEDNGYCYWDDVVMRKIS